MTPISSTNNIMASTSEVAPPKPESECVKLPKTTPSLGDSLEGCPELSI